MGRHCCRISDQHGLELSFFLPLESFDVVFELAVKNLPAFIVGVLSHEISVSHCTVFNMSKNSKVEVVSTEV